MADGDSEYSSTKGKEIIRETLNWSNIGRTKGAFPWQHKLFYRKIYMVRKSLLDWHLSYKMVTLHPQMWCRLKLLMKGRRDRGLTDGVGCLKGK